MFFGHLKKIGLWLKKKQLQIERSQLQWFARLTTPRKIGEASSAGHTQGKAGQRSTMNQWNQQNNL